MPQPYETLASAFENDRRVTVTGTDGTVYEDRTVEDFLHVETQTFEVWRFDLSSPNGTVRLYGPDLEAVEMLD